MGERRITRGSPRAAGVDPLVIGCTEVPLVNGRLPPALRAYSPICDGGEEDHSPFPAGRRRRPAGDRLLDAADAPAPCVDAAAVLVERTVAFPLGGWEP